MTNEVLALLKKRLEEGMPIAVGTRIERYDYSAPPIIYVGSAAVGTAAASTGWTIVKYDLTDSTNASGLIASDVSWNNRASGTYS